jgi:subfamily B ATP-binding cassette protein MsbA
MQHLANILRFGAPYLRRYWGRLAAGILLGVLFGVSNASFVWATRVLFERLDPGSHAAVVGPASSFLAERAAEFWRAVSTALDPWLPLMGRDIDWRQVVGGFLFLPALVAFRSFVGYLSSYCMNWVSERIMTDLRYDVLAQLYRLSLDFFNRSTMGDLLTRITADTGALHKAMTNGLSDIVKEPFTVVGVLAALCLVNAKLTLVAIVFLPFCVIPLVVLGKKVRRAVKASLTANISQASLLVEALSGIRVIKAFGLEANSLARFKEFSRQIIHHDMKSVQARELVNPLVETISLLGLGLLIVFIFVTRTSVPDLASFLMGVVLLFTPFKKLAAVHVLFQQASVGVDRLAHILREQPSVKEPAQPEPLRSFDRELCFEKVSFAYAEKTVLHGLDLTIPRGHKLGIAGESGSGKSTLVNLLFRFYDATSGAIRVDGHDVRAVASRDFQQLMALVSQEIVIFDLTVAENIACGKAGATGEEIEAAARAANAHEFISRLPQGYDTRVGERGVTLSGGQRQRLAIARAFVRNAPILLLDEATASLDSQSEAEVQAAIEKLEQNRTVVCVAHRLSTLANMDRILVLSEGRIVEEGRFDELLERGGRFAAMAARQGIGGGRG